MRAFKHWAFEYAGSTRPAALLRMSLALLLFYRFCLVGSPNLRHYSLALTAVMSIATFLMFIGYRSRLATFVAGAIGIGTFEYYWAYLGDAKWAHHHTYFLGAAALLLSLAPIGRSLSVDWLIASNKAQRAGQPAPLEEGNLYAMRLLAILLACLYFFAFWDKTFIANTNNVYYGFLGGARLEQIIADRYWGSDFVFPEWAHLVSTAASIIVAVLELALTFLLFKRFQKWWLILAGLGLHLAFYMMLGLSTYSLTCMVLYLAVLDANMLAGWLAYVSPPTLRTSALVQT